MEALKNWKWTLLVVVTGMILLSGGIPAAAADYPTKPINLVIQYPPGGSTDLTGRALANAAQKHLGQPLVCENKSGGGGTVGPALVKTKPADGYTIGIITSSPVIAWHMGKVNFNQAEDLTHILRWGNYLFGIAVGADSQWKTVQDLVQYCQKNPKKLTYGSPGVGTPPHLAMEEFSAAAGMQLTHMPYKGIAENNAALLGGHIDVISDSSGWAPLVDAGKFRLLATYGEKRSSRYPQVPTVQEAGYNVVARSHLGIIGPKGLPKPIVTRLHEAFKKAMDDPEFHAVLKKFDMTTYYLGPEDYEKYIRTEFDRIGILVKKLGLDKK